ncbi:hypothetical protein SDC9_100125 [bioreactor metagenome]|uniref:Uncharacterized protein n=1 Tax=bioreactor metagenome TaxID=1076179 RepID=A0A645AKU5_9ZZZZ
MNSHYAPLMEELRAMIHTYACMVMAMVVVIRLFLLTTMIIPALYLKSFILLLQLDGHRFMFRDTVLITGHTLWHTGMQHRHLL